MESKDCSKCAVITWHNSLQYIHVHVHCSYMYIRIYMYMYLKGWPVPRHSAARHWSCGNLSSGQSSWGRPPRSSAVRKVGLQTAWSGTRGNWRSSYRYTHRIQTTINFWLVQLKMKRLTCIVYIHVYIIYIQGFIWGEGQKGGICPPWAELCPLECHCKVQLKPFNPNLPPPSLKIFMHTCAPPHTSS